MCPLCEVVDMAWAWGLEGKIDSLDGWGECKIGMGY